MSYYNYKRLKLTDLYLKKDDLIEFVKEHGINLKLKDKSKETYINILNAIHNDKYSVGDIINNKLKEGKLQTVRLYKIIIYKYIEEVLAENPKMYTGFPNIPIERKMYDIPDLYKLIDRINTYITNYRFNSKEARYINNLLMYLKFYTGARSSTFMRSAIKTVEETKININGKEENTYYHLAEIKRGRIAFYAPINIQEININSSHIQKFNVFYSRLKKDLKIRVTNDYLQDPLRKAYTLYMATRVGSDLDMFDNIILGHTKPFVITKVYLQQVQYYREQSKRLYETYIFSSEYLRASYLSIIDIYERYKVS